MILGNILWKSSATERSGLSGSKMEEWKQYGKGKGCDLGYALAGSSCERVTSVETCTVTASDAITAFAVPNPGGASQLPSVFSGLVALWVTPPS
jgi:hypothetical protein